MVVVVVVVNGGSSGCGFGIHNAIDPQKVQQ
jgi:hypothetical protein